MANKKTVVQMYEEILQIAGLTDEQRAFIEKRIEITKKKNAPNSDAKPTKAQIENEGIKDTIITVLTAIGAPTPIGELIKNTPALSGYSNQKVSALLTQLLKAGKVVRTEVKGKAHYAVVSED